MMHEENACDRAPSLVVACVLVGALVLTTMIVFAARFEIPVPKVHDEFSYLLGADTFVHGRLTNPTHPMHRFFASYHVFHTPTYQSKYPPAQAAFMALGQVIGGEPILGVWLCFALACVATLWMLWPILPPWWCVLGGLWPLFNIYIFFGWGQSYWGGAAAWLGSAMVVGGVVRQRARFDIPSGCVGGAGLFILGNARPFEGAIFAALLLGVVIVEVRSCGPRLSWRELALRALPLFVGGGLLGVWTLFYNASLTGTPFLFPHQHFAHIQAVTPALAWRSPPAQLRLSLVRIGDHFVRFWTLFAIPFAVWRFRRSVFMWGMLGIVTVLAGIVLFGSAAHSHYFAPLFPVYVGFVVVGLFALSRYWGRVGIGLSILLMAGQCWGWSKVVRRLWRDGPPHDWAHERHEFLRHLKQQGGKHLVLVKTTPGWNRHHEWVYNPADLNGATVLFARDLGKEKNAELLAYFSDRNVIALRLGSDAEGHEETDTPAVEDTGQGDGG